MRSSNPTNERDFLFQSVMEEEDIVREAASLLISHSRIVTIEFRLHSSITSKSQIADQDISSAICGRCF